jgi:predicted nucleic acid-binding protein
LLDAKDKNQRDRALAATARVRGFVLVTRNIADFRGCGVQVLDPFAKNPCSATIRMRAARQSR